MIKVAGWNHGLGHAYNHFISMLPSPLSAAQQLTDTNEEEEEETASVGISGKTNAQTLQATGGALHRLRVCGQIGYLFKHTEKKSTAEKTSFYLGHLIS